LGELRKAKSMLRRALDEEPQHERAQTLLAEVEES
jgi:Tfp pilus assembly protein PilF